MGVEGAAIATVVSQVIAAILCMIYAYKKVSYIKMAVQNPKPDKAMILQAMKVGLPTGIQYALIYVSTIVLQKVVNGFGESMIGAFTSVSQMEILVQQIYSALGAAMVTYTGQNIGAGKVERVKKGMRSAISISAVISVVLLVVFLLGGDFIMRMFVPDEEIISISVTGVRITGIFFMGLGVVQILRYLLNGAGDSYYAMFNGMVEIVARIVFVYLLTSISFIGKWGVFLTTGLTWVVTAVFAFIRYKSGAWMNKSFVESK